MCAYNNIELTHHGGKRHVRRNINLSLIDNNVSTVVDLPPSKQAVGSK